VLWCVTGRSDGAQGRPAGTGYAVSHIAPDAKRMRPGGALAIVGVGTFEGVQRSHFRENLGSL
jgi:hypothetical protein